MRKAEQAHQAMLTAVDWYGEDLMAEQPGADPAQLEKLHKEAERLKQLSLGHQQEAESKRQEREEEAAQQPLSEGGLQLADNRPKAKKPVVGKASDKRPIAKRAAQESAVAEPEKLANPTADPGEWEKAAKGSLGYLEDTDLTHFLRSRVNDIFINRKFRVDGWACVLVTKLDKFDGHANVATKRGKRALFYSIDMTISWAALEKMPDDGEEPEFGKVCGAFRLYNVAQDTQFMPGGGDGTSYMYQLGFDTRNSEDLITQTKQVGEVLFYRFSGAIKAVVSQLLAKCEKAPQREQPEMVDSSGKFTPTIQVGLQNQSRPDQFEQTNLKPIKGFLNSDPSKKKKKKKQSLNDWAEQRKPKGMMKGFLG